MPAHEMAEQQDGSATRQAEQRAFRAARRRINERSAPRGKRNNGMAGAMDGRNGLCDQEAEEGGLGAGVMVCGCPMRALLRR